MSPVGHSLTGLAFAAIALPAGRSRKWQLAVAAIFVALANLPDWPLPHWGHERYDISHSIYVNLALIGLALSLWMLVTRFKSPIPYRWLLVASLAWLSHLLLDSFYNHGNGVAIFWPFSEGALNFSMPWFNTLKIDQSPISQHNLSVFLIEAIAFFPILVIAIIVGKITRKQTLGFKTAGITHE